jgi:hypothetical protein
VKSRNSIFVAIVVVGLLFSGCSSPQITATQAVAQPQATAAPQRTAVLPARAVTQPTAVPQTSAPAREPQPVVNAADDELTQYFDSTKSLRFLHPSAVNNCIERSVDTSEIRFMVVCLNGPSVDKSNMQVGVALLLLNADRISNQDWQAWTQQQQNNLAGSGKLVNYEVHGRQLDAELAETVNHSHAWYHFEERDGVLALLVMAVPNKDQARFSSVWSKVRASLEWDSSVIQISSPVIPTTVSTPDNAAASDSSACLDQCNAYTDLNQWQACITGCLNITPVPPAASDSSACLDQCSAYTDLNLWSACVNNCVGISGPVAPPISQPSGQNQATCDKARREYKWCMDTYNEMKSVAAKASMYRTCLDWQDTINRYCQ